MEKKNKEYKWLKIFTFCIILNLNLIIYIIFNQKNEHEIVWDVLPVILE